MKQAAGNALFFMEQGIGYVARRFQSVSTPRGDNDF